MVENHASDGSDAAGLGLVITIRIGPDGRLYFHDIPGHLLPVVRSLCPDDEGLRRRAMLAEQLLNEDEPG